MKKKRIGAAFPVGVFALVVAVAALVMYFVTYRIGSYTINRWALICTALGIWFVAFLCLNMVIKGDKPAWCSIFYVLAVFLLTYGLLRFLQPCLTPIGFAFGASDLNMGDTQLNKTVAYFSVATAALYIVSVFCIILAAFLPAERKVKEFQED